MEQMIIAVDPGREKCGIAVVHQKQTTLMQDVIATDQLTIIVKELLTKYKVKMVVVGDGTSSQEAKDRLEKIIIEGEAVKVTFIDERHSTDQARKRYWKENPPKGLKRLIPVTMQVPPKPVDDYVAVILAERYFAEMDTLQGDRFNIK